MVQKNRSIALYLIGGRDASSPDCLNLFKSRAIETRFTHMHLDLIILILSWEWLGGDRETWNKTPILNEMILKFLIQSLPSSQSMNQLMLQPLLPSVSLQGN